MNSNSDLSPQAKLAQHRAALEQLWSVSAISQARLGSPAKADLPTGCQINRQVNHQVNRQSNITTLLTGWGLGLLTWLTAGDSPRVRQRLTPRGWRWQGFDPWNGQRQTFETEAELRAWLESRYGR